LGESQEGLVSTREVGVREMGGQHVGVNEEVEAVAIGQVAKRNWVHALGIVFLVGERNIFLSLIQTGKRSLYIPLDRFFFGQ
jgi:hypothetical protein